MEELNLNPTCYDIKIKEDKHVKIMFNRIYKMPQVNATELYVSSEPLAEVDAEKVQQTITSLQFITLDDGCTTMRGYTMGGYTLPS